MPALPRPSAVLFVADVAAMTRFYQTLAAMTLLQQDDQHAVLEVEGFQLVVHALRGAPGAATPPVPRPLREDSHIKLCFPVASIGAARTRAAALGGAIKPAANEWEARGFRACDGHDPEGNVLQVREHAGAA